MSDNIRTDKIELLCTKDDFVELMDDNASLCEQVERLTASVKTHNDYAVDLSLRIMDLEARIKVLEDANEMLETRLSRARALLEEEAAIDAVNARLT